MAQIRVSSIVRYDIGGRDLKRHGSLGLLVVDCCCQLAAGTTYLAPAKTKLHVPDSNRHEYRNEQVPIANLGPRHLPRYKQVGALMIPT